MKHHLASVIICLSLVPLAGGQSDRQALLGGQNRDLQLSNWIKKIEQKSEVEWSADARNESLSKETRIASAVALLRKNGDPAKAFEAACPIFAGEMPPGLDEWESSSDWKKLYPVAAAVASRPDLTRLVVEAAVAGTLPEKVAGFVLIQYQSTGSNPRQPLLELKEQATSPEKTALCERLLAVIANIPDKPAGEK